MLTYEELQHEIQRRRDMHADVRDADDAFMDAFRFLAETLAEQDPLFKTDAKGYVKALESGAQQAYETLGYRLKHGTAI